MLKKATINFQKSLTLQIFKNKKKTKKVFLRESAIHFAESNLFWWGDLRKCPQCQCSYFSSVLAIYFHAEHLFYTSIDFVYCHLPLS